MTLPITAIIFDCDLRAPAAVVVRSFTPRVWPGVAYARADMTYSLNLACCAALCSRLRLLAAEMAASAETPPLGIPTL